MNTIESNLTDHEQRELDAWCAEVRAAHAEVTRPIEIADPRFAELEKVHGPGLTDAGFTPEELGELCFQNSTARIPAWPLETPAWAVETQVFLGIYPEINIEFTGKAWGTVEWFQASIQQMNTVFVDDFVNDDGTVQGRPGDIKFGEARIYVEEHDENLSADEAFQLARTIQDAATELGKYTA